MKKPCEVLVGFTSHSGDAYQLVLRNFIHPGHVTSEHCRFIKSAIAERVFTAEAGDHAAELMARHETSLHAGDEPVIKDLPQEEPISEECPEPRVEEGQHLGVMPDEEETDLGRPPGQWSVEESIEKLRDYSRSVCETAVGIPNDAVDPRLEVIKMMFEKIEKAIDDLRKELRSV